ncbi:kinesin-like protein KIFC3-like, partial [Trifolium medium]|nr:kinesin-like protein KIFC3-like [Trifolium medium]
VFCRCRPLNAEEIKGGAAMALDFDSAKDGELTVMSNGSPKKTFKFDAVFGPQVEQDFRLLSLQLISLRTLYHLQPQF